MSRDDASRQRPLDHLADCVTRQFESSSLLGDLTLVEVSQDGRTLRVVFDGVPDVRSGRFGVHIPTPEKIGDRRWFEFPVDLDQTPEDWVRMALILELIEVYDTSAQSSEVPPDSNGIVWLS